MANQIAVGALIPERICNEWNEICGECLYIGFQNDPLCEIIYYQSELPNAVLPEDEDSVTELFEGEGFYSNDDLVTEDFEFDYEEMSRGSIAPLSHGIFEERVETVIGEPVSGVFSV
tara:strand:+ start:1486 stop:1836 length:351 start_codon:yes stop_codon:yes gene_type:complete